MSVNVFQAGLMHMLMRVFAPVGVGVGVFVLDVAMLMGGVCMCVGDVAVLVFVRVRHIVGVLFAHWCLSFT